MTTLANAILAVLLGGLSLCGDVRAADEKPGPLTRWSGSSVNGQVCPAAKRVTAKSPASTASS